ncbi:hypothetical protein PGB90_002641 [Kerria lacca]
MDMEILSKLEALRFEYCELKLKYETETNELLCTLEENDRKTTSYMKELREISDTASSTEELIKAFYRKLATDTQRNPKPKLSWWRGSELLDHTYEVHNDSIKNILSLDNLQRENADDQLICKSENSKLTATVTAAVYVNLYLSAKEIRLVGENKEMSAGHQYEIICESIGSKPPANITWWKNSVLINGPVKYSTMSSEENEVYQIDKGEEISRAKVSSDRKKVISILTFTPDETDSGKTLSCEALNVFVPHEKRIRDRWTIKVNYEPQCRSNQQRVYGAERNEDVNITCIVDGNPSPTWFRWSFNNSMVHIVSVNNFLNGNGSSVIKYKPVTEANYGTLMCSSQNELGPQVVPCVFHIVSAGKPDPPHNCSVANLTQSWLYVKCLRGFDGGLPQEFICEVIQEWNDKVISNITSKTQPEFRLTGLEARTSYRIVIYATNVKGKSKENVLLSITTLPNVTSQSRRSVSGYTNTFLKFHWIVKLIIIVVLVMLCIVVILVILVRIAILRKRKKRSQNSEEIRKMHLSQGSLSHNEDDKNPDLIPQSTVYQNSYQAFRIKYTDTCILLTFAVVIRRIISSANYFNNE